MSYEALQIVRITAKQRRWFFTVKLCWSSIVLLPVVRSSDAQCLGRPAVKWTVAIVKSDGRCIGTFL